MRSARLLAILALGSAAAFASGVTLLALDSSEDSNAAAKIDRRLTRAAFAAMDDDVESDSITEPNARFAFVPRGSIPSPIPAATEGWTATSSIEAEEAESWSVETRTNSPLPQSGPRLSAMPPQRFQSMPIRPGVPGNYSLNERLSELSPRATRRLADKFDSAKVAWPPDEIGLVAIKDEKTIELFARQAGGEWKFVHRYAVLAASGSTGPKLRQGDKQVPEGIYNISFLNPNSRYHVSLRVNYPNAFDREMAGKDGRKDLGGDIMIHGKAASVGCLAVGDEAAEELFVLTAQVGLPNTKLIIAPTDFRRGGTHAVDPSHPAWVSKLYTEVASAMTEFKAPPKVGLMSLLGNLVTGAK